ncbi:MAG: alpha/beta hydrolase [Kiritimatiellae bacterium]|nr:alpha/beta hydrolase [Kiritimatiellia bacterium]
MTADRPTSAAAPFAVRSEARDVRNPKTGNVLRGTLYRPEGAAGPLPLALFAHEFGGHSRSPWWVRYATHLAAAGIAAYAFDFAGGGESCRSDGKTTDMSVLTEADDLESVLDAARGWTFADPARILLCGGSQGGTVAAIVAARRAEAVARLVLLYPAFVIRDDLHAKFASPEAVPAVFRYNDWVDVGPRYVRDMWDFDVYEAMPSFARPVLIVHGDRDAIAPLPYSERAAATYPDARLAVLEADTHAFLLPETQERCLAAIDAFLRETAFHPAAPRGNPTKGPP